MRIDLTSLMFNMNIAGGGGTPSWGTALGQKAGHKYTVDGYEELLVGMVYSKIPDINNVYCPLGKGGARQADYEYTLASHFKKVFVNGKLIPDASFVLLIVTQLVANATQHIGRKQLKYNPKITYNSTGYNEDCYKKMTAALGLTDDSSWFVSDINVRDQDELHFTAKIADKDKAMDFSSSEERTNYCMGLAEIKRAPGGYNKIYYGAPGCGKSYYVEHDILQKNGVVKENYVRTTFHPDFSNSDFVGQIMPFVETKVDPSDSSKTIEKVTYKFSPGPFALALKRAYETEKMVYLIIEEINRGNASAIFGEFFQLLDRYKDPTKDNFGESEYPITDVNLQKYLSDELGTDFSSIVIPTNLTIIATMNSSDQNVFTLDTAFKRRWSFEQIGNDIDADAGHPYKNWYVPGTTITWATFMKKVNDKILLNKIANSTSEDKRLGKYFVTPDCMTKDPVALKDAVGEANNFAYKVLEYLWNDVCKYGQDQWFDVERNRTLEELIDNFKKDGLAIFQNINFNE